jgi:hypothetical protein
MINTIVGARAVGAGAASRYGSGSGSDQKMRLLAAPALQHCLQYFASCIERKCCGVGAGPTGSRIILMDKEAQSDAAPVPTMIFTLEKYYKLTQN